MTDPQGDLGAALAALRHKQGKDTPGNLATALAKIRGGTDPRTTRHDGTPFVDATPDTSETPGDRAAGAISAAYQGLSLGMGNKITAGVRTLAPQFAGGVKGFDYPTALKEQTQVLDDYRHRRPVAAGALELAGSLPTVVGTGGLGAARLSPVMRVAVGALKGAGYGGVAGGSEAIRPGAALSDVGSGAKTGAEIGGVLGGGIPLAGAVAGSTPMQAALALMGHHGSQARMMGKLVSALRKAATDAATLSEVAAPEASAARVPTASISPQMQSAVDMLTPDRSDLLRLFNTEAQTADAALAREPASMLDVAKRQRHRTQASFDDFSVRRGGQPQQPPHRTIAPADAVPHDGLIGDAEIAQGLDQPEPDLLDQLRRSIIAKGGVPRRVP